MKRKRGALASVLKAMELGTPLPLHSRRETALCDYCGQELSFGTDEIGRTTVRCSSRVCRNHRTRLLNSGPLLVKRICPPVDRD